MNLCTIYDPVEPPPSELVQRLAELPTSALSDSMQRNRGAPGLLPVHDAGELGRVAGPAVTVKTRPGDNVVVHKALDLARPGEVLTVDASGGLDNAIFGEVMSRYARSKGIAAVVIDGAVRDVAGIRALGFPVFARGVNHMGPYKSGPGEIRGPISIGGSVVVDGDVVVGDADGVAAIPRARLEEVAASAEALVAKERDMIAAIDAGTLDRCWIDEALTVERRDRV